MNTHDNINKLSRFFDLNTNEKSIANSIPEIIYFHETVIETQEIAFKKAIRNKISPIARKIVEKLTKPLKVDIDAFLALKPKLKDAVNDAIDWKENDAKFNESVIIELSEEEMGQSAEDFANKVNGYWKVIKKGKTCPLAKLHVGFAKSEIFTSKKIKDVAIFTFELLPPAN